MKCIHYTRAEADVNRLTRKLMAETSPRRRASIRASRNEFAKQMEQHRNCRCQELQEAI